MSQRRMFSNRIANSAKFLQMPTESQLLYFHFILRADDDGIVESYPVMKLLGIAPDAFKVLVVKQFIQVLNDDQVIVIEDWLEHNQIRPDRKVDSIYKHLLPEGTKTIEPKPRSDVKDNSKRVGGQSTDGISKVRLGKYSIVKDSISNTSNTISEPKVSHDVVVQIIDSFKDINKTAYKRWYGNKTQRQACQNLIETHGIEKVLAVIEILPKTNTEPYYPKITSPYELEQKWQKLEDTYQTNINKNKQKPLVFF